ncbi:hypothetical protein N566_13055 [Streptomycetaceae bacterium MP113-05]|nr:hypothetical protein N566_13055 [Streptomycetaceae bacterium MP113-05]
MAGSLWEETLGELALNAGNLHLFRPHRTTPGKPNLISSWTERVRPGAGLPRLTATRLRTTWIVSLMATRVDHGVIAKVAGLKSAASLARYQHLVPQLDEETVIRLQRDARW